MQGEQITLRLHYFHDSPAVDQNGARLDGTRPLTQRDIEVRM